jgi:2-polyprenyl-3-methyl-5-hydroxy-6-metoxy-1,4-benzoquinol methylase
MAFTVMTEAQTDDAVRYFSETARQFQDLYHGQPEFHERVRIWNGLLDRYAPRDGLSLDMGCGPGIFSFYLAAMGGRVVGIDGAADMVELCEVQRRERGLENIRFVQARLPVVDESDLADADLIISSSVVEYIDNLDATLVLFARLLKPGGVLVVSMPNVVSLSRIHQRMKYMLTRTPGIYQYIRHFSSPALLHRRVRPYGLTLAEALYYTHFTRLARLGRALRLPGILTADLFVAVFRKT